MEFPKGEFWFAFLVRLSDNYNSPYPWWRNPSIGYEFGLPGRIWSSWKISNLN